MAHNRFRDSHLNFRLLVALGAATFLLPVALLGSNLVGGENDTRDAPQYPPLPTITSENAPTSPSEIYLV